MLKNDKEASICSGFVLWFGNTSDGREIEGAKDRMSDITHLPAPSHDELSVQAPALTVRMICLGEKNLNPVV